jgi:TetR/AcrR family transcriptional repressor of nem operon
LAGALVRAQDQGELGEDKDPQALARFLITLVQGIRVMAKRPDRQRLRDAIDQAVSLLT